MRNNKRFAAVALLAAVGIFATACGSDTKTATPGTTAGTTGGTTGATMSSTPLNLGVAFDTGGRGDGTFNDSAARGADKAKTDLGAKLDELEATSDQDRKPNLETLTKNGDNPIIAVGFLFGDDLKTIATANPKTTYGIIDSVVDAPNVKSLVFAEEQGSFLVGAAAALKSKTGHIGFIGGQEIDLIKKFQAGYAAGAMAVNPKIIIDVKYLGAAGDNAAWGSPDKAKEIANGWYAAGADIIYTAAGGSGAGTIDAAVASGKWAIGVDSDQYVLATDEQKKHILTSMIKRVDVAVFETAKAVQSGDTKGGVQVFDLKVDGVGYATSGGYLDDVKDKLEAFKKQIIDGTIKVPTAP